MCSNKCKANTNGCIDTYKLIIKKAFGYSIMKLFQNNNTILLALAELHINICIYTLETVVVVIKEIDKQLCLI